jgi:hypothetical protein
VSHQPPIGDAIDLCNNGGLRTWDRLGITAARANALKNHWLIDDAAAAEVADRHDQPRTAVTPKKVELARIGPSATMPSFGVCPEPAPIEQGNLLQWARHRDRGPTKKSVASREAGAGHTKAVVRTDNLNFIIKRMQRRKHYKT